MFISSKGIKKGIVGVVLISLVAGLSKCTGIDQKIIYDWVDEIQREYFPSTPVNDHIIKNPELLERRIKRDVERTIDEVTPEYDRIIQQEERYQPRYLEKPVNPETQKGEASLLGGEMRMCAPWVADCN